MPLETKIDALTQVVIALIAQMQTNNVAPAVPVAQVAAPVAAPAPVVAAAPVAAPAPVMPAAPAPFAMSTAAANNAMPAAPSFVAPVAAPAPADGAPFTDGKGLIDYVMGAYKALGPAKGASIQAVLTQLGYANINDVKPEHYGSLFSGIEALKV